MLQKYKRMTVRLRISFKVQLSQTRLSQSLGQKKKITLYKRVFFANYPCYLKDLPTVRSLSYNLRGNHILALPNQKTTIYCLHAFSKLASNIRNSLRDIYSNMQPFHSRSRYIMLYMHNIVFSLEIMMVLQNIIFYFILFYFFFL